ncbi:DUF4333 domain-containing protein [Streptomyces niveiscabiei]|uniref:DUF4333 domain-containing protein n=1 Tax=Streptomyces niveiscabiei TaxID=164115 RepID=UPI0029B4C471|nr:DUF4333 domain-containing protein [Streptomyces niveiscabiei]MDX3382152.1 DUF4333 domain-containing protein [Streptomyces niveiscabiei]
MQRSKFVIGLVGCATAAVAVGAVGTHLLSGTQSTTGLDERSAVRVNGYPALSKNVVEGRIQSRNHPLPWVGAKLRGVSCPTGLKAVAGATITCRGEKNDGRTVEIPVSVVKATPSSVTWKFER